MASSCLVGCAADDAYQAGLDTFSPDLGGTHGPLFVFHLKGDPQNVGISPLVSFVHPFAFRGICIRVIFGFKGNLSVDIRLPYLFSRGRARKWKALILQEGFPKE